MEIRKYLDDKAIELELEWKKVYEASFSLRGSQVLFETDLVAQIRTQMKLFCKI